VVASGLLALLVLLLGLGEVGAVDPVAAKPVSQGVAKAGASNVTLNLKGADLETLVETVAKATGKNFVLDPKVQGKVTVVSHKPVSGEELYAIFLSVLEVHGFMAVPVGSVIKILPDNDLKYQAKPDSDASVGSDEVVAQVFRLRFVDAGRIIPVLRPLLGPKAHMSAHPDTNSLVVSGRSAEIARLEKLLERVDHPFTETIETVTLEHAKASDVHRISTELSKIMAPDNSQEKVVIVADERTNSILLGGQPDARLRMRMIIGKLDAAVEVSGNTRVIGLKFAKAEDIAKILSNMGENFLKENKQDKQPNNSLVNVQAYTGDNSLVISAPAELLRSMAEVVRVLDRRRRQVQVKAIIAEVSYEKVAELGVQWDILAKGKNDRDLQMGVNFPSANPSLIELGAAAQKPDSADALNVVKNAAGLLIGGSNGNDLVALLRALKNDVDTNILSTPSVVTLDNEEAEIIVGSEVPFITSSATNNAGNPFQTISRQNVGLTLKVKPLITDGDTVRLDISQEVSSLLPDAKNVQLSDAVTRTRRIKTSVLVEDQQILVLGGLIQDDMQQSASRVPFLSDIPLLGALFRSERSSGIKTNLMVFLRPQVLRDVHSGVNATEESYRIMRELQLEIPEIKGPVRLDDKRPLLPEWGEQLRMSRLVDTSREVVSEDLPSASGGVSLLRSPETDVGAEIKMGDTAKMAEAGGRPTGAVSHEREVVSSPSVLRDGMRMTVNSGEDSLKKLAAEEPVVERTDGQRFSLSSQDAVKVTKPTAMGGEKPATAGEGVKERTYKENQDYGD